MLINGLNFSSVSLFSFVLCTWPSVNVTVCVLRVEERLNSYAAAKAVVLSRQDLIACLLAISLLRLSLGAALLGL